MFHRKKWRQTSSSTVGNKHAQKQQRPLEETPAPLQQHKPAVQIKLAFKDSKIEGFKDFHFRYIYTDEVKRN